MEAAIAVAGISIQLADTLNKLITFWKDVQRAPAEVRALFEDVEALSALLAQAQSSNRHEGLDGLAEKILGRCEEKVTALYAKVRKAAEGLASESARKRKWSALKISLDKADINELRDQLKEAKAMLVIVKLDSFERSTSQTLQTQERVLLEILRAVRVASIQPSDILPWKSVEWLESDMQLLTSPSTELNPPNYSRDTRAACINIPVQPHEVSPNSKNHVQKKASQNISRVHGRSSLISTPFGPVKTWSSIKATAKKSSNSNTAEEKDSVLAFYPSWLLRRLGVSYGLWIQGRSTDGWQFTIQPFNAVPEDAPIFRYCRLGDVAAVKTLLSSGYASLRDRDPKGRTPLWYASGSLQVEVADFLLEQGADAHAVDWETKRSTIAALYYSAQPDVSNKVSMVSVYERHVPDGYHDDSILCLIGMMLHSYRPGRSLDLCPAKIDREKSVMRIITRISELWLPDDHQQSMILKDLVLLGYSDRVVHWYLSGITTLEGSCSAMILNSLIGKGTLIHDPPTMRLALDRTSNLHSQSLSERDMRWMSPTAHTMYHPQMFFAWKKLLLERGHKLEDFVRDELDEKESALAAQGWTYDKLLSLFKSHSSSNLNSNMNQACQRCGISAKTTWMVDLQWRQFLQGVREGKLKPGLADPGVQNITLDFRDQTGLPCSAVGQHDSLDLPTDAGSLPYQMVCSWQCRDKIPVSRAFDGTSDGEVFLPLYPLEQETKREREMIADKITITEIDCCPTKRMPGSFVD
ncbi:hypothetical protein DL95DRAFT_447176 [Leptodontidium sp. 2 PMI_412]|nr:hypothetical protein DL95DRAFT_447176 [Leptodontidium sp. 2 PMI_412]